MPSYVIASSWIAFVVRHVEVLVDLVSTQPIPSACPQTPFAPHRMQHAEWRVPVGCLEIDSMLPCINLPAPHASVPTSQAHVVWHACHSAMRHVGWLRIGVPFRLRFSLRMHGHSSATPNRHWMRVHPVRAPMPYIVPLDLDFGWSSLPIVIRLNR